MAVGVIDGVGVAEDCSNSVVGVKIASVEVGKGVAAPYVVVVKDAAVVNGVVAKLNSSAEESWPSDVARVQLINKNNHGDTISSKNPRGLRKWLFIGYLS